MSIRLLQRLPREAELHAAEPLLLGIALQAAGALDVPQRFVFEPWRYRSIQKACNEQASIIRQCERNVKLLTGGWLNFSYFHSHSG